MSLELLAKAKTPQEVANIHYGAVTDDDYDLFLETLTEAHRESAEYHLSIAMGWWRSAKMFRERYGCYWKFHDLSRQEGDHVRLRYQRKNGDGTDRGKPNPIMLTKEAGEWRVYRVSY